jgi:hypothetical protein
MEAEMGTHNLPTTFKVPGFLLDDWIRCSGEIGRSKYAIPARVRADNFTERAWTEEVLVTVMAVRTTARYEMERALVKLPLSSQLSNTTCEGGPV